MKTTIRVASDQPGTAPRRVACASLLMRKEIWTLSWRGWFLALALAAVSGVTIFFSIHPFLSVTNQNASADILVVEGWIPDYALEESWEEFKQGHYRLLLVTGSRGREGPGNDLNDTYAGWGAERLQKIVGQHKEIIPVPGFEAQRDRTYASAVALGAWLKQNRQKTRDINVFTIDAHARRTRLVFEKALGPGMHVGVLAVADRDYDPKRWWHSSEGVREVVGESIAYLYVRLFFYP